MAVNIPGLVGILIFYLIILIIGILAARYKTKRNSHQVGVSESETVMASSRDIGIFVGVFTMTATWVGGGYINGTAEALYSTGLAWCQAPFGYSLSLVLGGLFFAKTMRERKYLTMLDPFQERYGARIGGLLYLPALTGEIFWSAAILKALGTTISVILDINETLSVIISALVAVGYTFFGGLYSVAYTDVVQLFCIVIGLVLPIPFMYQSEFITHRANTTSPTAWIGTLEVKDLGTYIDIYLLLICGGMPWQIYFQRVLAAKSPRTAQLVSFMAAGGCIIMCIPPAVIGILARGADWDAAGFNSTFMKNNIVYVLPVSIQYLTPIWVSLIGLGAVSAAVMSSADSSTLSASSLFAHNIYNNVFRQNASDKEILWVLRFAIVACGVLACTLALLLQSIYALFYLCSDLVYVILFPQLVCVIYVSFVNSYGVLSGYFIGLLFRLLAGEKEFNLPQVIPFDTVNFPFRTLAMLLNLVTTLLVSCITNWIFHKGIVSSKFDYLGISGNSGDSTRKISNKDDPPKKNFRVYPTGAVSNGANWEHPTVQTSKF